MTPPSGRRRVIANIGWLGADRILRMGGALLVGTMLARYLGPDNFGIFNLANAIFVLFNTVSTLGLDYLVVRDVVLHPETNHDLLGSAALLKAVASVVTTLAAIAFAWLMHPGEPVLVGMVALLSVAAITQAFDVVDFFFQGKTLSQHTVLPKLLVFVVVNLLRLLAIYRHASVLVFVELAAVEIAAGELALLASYLRFPHAIPAWRASAVRMRSLLRQGLPLMLAGLLVMLYMRVDQVLLGYLAGTRTVGLYSAAIRLSEIWYAVPVLICNSFMPRLLLSFSDDRKHYEQRLQTLYNLLVAVSVALAIATLPVSRWVVMLIFGKAYLPAAGILNVHIWTGVFVSIGVLGGQQLIHEQMQMVELRRAALGMVVNVGLNLLLIPRFGALGSAWATLAAQAVASYLADAFSTRTRHIFWMKTRALSGWWLLRWRTAHPAAEKG